MPAASWLQLSVYIAALALLGVTAWVKRNDSKIKAKADEDKKIDSLSNADDILSELDRLRNEPPANRG